MKNLIFTLFLLVLPLQIMWAQTEKAFPQYTWINTLPSGSMKDGSRFGYEKASFTPIHKFCTTLPQSDPCYEKEDYDGMVLLGRYKNASMKDHVNILYSPGPSDDPQFFITDKNNKPIWNELAEEMCINSGGVIYVSGNTNKMFNQRMKFQFSNGKVTEIEQPFYYVGVNGKLLKPIKLYSRKNNQGTLIATLPEGYGVEVLLSEAENEQVNFLVRTDFGLVGWLYVPIEYRSAFQPIIRGLGFLGD